MAIISGKDDIRIPIRVTGDKKAVTGINRVRGALGKLTPSFASVKRGAMIAAAAIAGMTVAIYALVKSTATAGDMFHKMSLRTGMSAQALSELKYAAEISGASIDDVEKGVKTLAKRLSDASFGLETYKRIFRDLKIEWLTGAGQLREVDDVMMDAIEAINKLGSESKKSAMMQELFGKAGAKLLPLFKEGKIGIEKLREAARQMGITWTDLEAKQAAAFIDRLTDLKGALSGVKKAIAMDLMPAMTDFFARLAQYIAENRPQIVALAKDFINSFASMAESAIIATAHIVDAFRSLNLGFKQLRIEVLESRMNALNNVIERFAKKGKEAPAEVYDKFKELILKIIELRQELEGGFEKGLLAERIRALIDGLKNVKVVPEDMPNLIDALIGKPEDVDAKVETLAAKTREALQTQWDTLFLTESERLDLWFSTEYEKIQEHEEAKLILYQIYMEKKRLLDEEQAQTGIDIAKQAAQQEMMIQQHKLSMTINMLNTTQNVLGAFASFSGKQNKALFLMQKAVAIAMIWVQTQIAAMSAAAAVAGIPIVGPALAKAAYAKMQILGYISMAAAAATAIGQMAAGSGALSGGGVGGEGGYAYTSPTTPTQTEEVTKPQVINVHIYGNVVDNDKYARELVEATQKALSDGAH